jgi:hypothetical protein
MEQKEKTSSRLVEKGKFQFTEELLSVFQLT